MEDIRRGVSQRRTVNRSVGVLDLGLGALSESPYLDSRPFRYRLPEGSHCVVVGRIYEIVDDDDLVSDPIA